jgi:hypothetical protein
MQILNQEYVCKKRVLKAYLSSFSFRPPAFLKRFSNTDMSLSAFYSILFSSKIMTKTGLSMFMQTPLLTSPSFFSNSLRLSKIMSFWKLGGVLGILTIASLQIERLKFFKLILYLFDSVA